MVSVRLAQVSKKEISQLRNVYVGIFLVAHEKKDARIVHAVSNGAANFKGEEVHARFDFRISPSASFIG